MPARGRGRGRLRDRARPLDPLHGRERLRGARRQVRAGPVGRRRVVPAPLGRRRAHAPLRRGRGALRARGAAERGRAGGALEPLRRGGRATRARSSSARWATPGCGDSPYRRIFRRDLDESIVVYWTGPEVVSYAIAREELDVAVERFGGRTLMLWDNYPVNDFESERLFLGPLLARDPRLFDGKVAGLIANAMVQAVPSKLALATVADFARDPFGYDPVASFERALARVRRRGRRGAARARARTGGGRRPAGRRRRARGRALPRRRRRDGARAARAVRRRYDAGGCWRRHVGPRATGRPETQSSRSSHTTVMSIWRGFGCA